MNYVNLNKTQKRVIDAFIKIRPELANTSTITRPEVEELFFKLHSERETGGDRGRVRGQDFACGDQPWQQAQGQGGCDT